MGLAIFELGSEVRFRATVTDYDAKTLFNPDSQTVTLISGSSTVTSGTPTSESTGIFYFSYQSSNTDPEGYWYVEWSITKSAITTIARKKFLVQNSGAE